MLFYNIHDGQCVGVHLEMYFKIGICHAINSFGIVLANANLINAIQGFNTVNGNISNGFANVNQNLANLGYKMEECCCSIKTMLLENRLQDTQIALQNAQNVAVNAQQSQYLLSQLGTFVPTAGA